MYKWFKLSCATLLLSLTSITAHATTHDDVYQYGISITEHVYGEANLAVAEFMANVAVVQTNNFDPVYMQDSTRYDRYGIFAMSPAEFEEAMDASSKEFLEFVDGDSLVIDNLKVEDTALAMAIVYLNMYGPADWPRQISTLEGQAQVWADVWNEHALDPIEYEICLKKFKIVK